ncbi:protein DETOXIFICATION 23-like [Euphorbia lathyris]|uniref:protein DETOXIFICATION 23-like n=1 Tax=Euphorbia lathyris TaxID=212925 RepID=UPI003313A9F6
MEGEQTENLLANRDIEEIEEEEMKLKEKIWSETKKMWKIAGPAIFTRLSTFGISIITQAFIGRIGSIELAAYSLVGTVLLRFGNGVLIGMASALETTCGQSYGAKQYHMLGIYRQRSWILLFSCCLLLLPMFFFATPILMALGQDPEISRVAGHISLWLIPILFSYIPSYTCQMFLQAQTRNNITAYLAAFSLSFYLLLSWLLTVKYKFGVHGAMLSAILAYWILNLGQLLYVICGSCSETWKGFSMLAFKDLWSIFRLSLTSGVMLW